MKIIDIEKRTKEIVEWGDDAPEMRFSLSFCFERKNDGTVSTTGGWSGGDMNLAVSGLVNQMEKNEELAELIRICLAEYASEKLGLTENNLNNIKS